MNTALDIATQETVADRGVGTVGDIPVRVYRLQKYFKISVINITLFSINCSMCAKQKIYFGGVCPYIKVN